jgi:hypothetical protein
MTMLVHLAAANDVAAVRRGGLRVGKGRPGLYAMPVLPNYVVSHQWLRELKRRGQRVFFGVYFRLRDDETVWVGHYGGGHEQATAAEAAGRIMRAETPLGFEIIVPRSIAAKEIVAVRRIPRVLGWRYFPGAHGRKPCGCPACQWRGAIKSRKLREDYERSAE